MPARGMRAWLARLGSLTPPGNAVWFRALGQISAWHDECSALCFRAAGLYVIGKDFELVGSAVFFAAKHIGGWVIRALSA